MNVFAMAYRSIVRNRRRTLVTISAMSLAGFICVLYGSLMEGLLATMERNAVSMDIGELQVHAQGYKKDPDLYKRIPNLPKLLDRLDKAGYLVSPRLYGYGLAAGKGTSSGVELRGVDIKREAQVTDISGHLKLGKWLAEDDPQGVVIGRKLAKTLAVKPGDELVVVSQAADGSMANELYKVRGILRAVTEGIDRSGLFMIESQYRELMAVPDGAHSLVIKRKNPLEELPQASQSIAALAPKMETQTWKELQPALAKMLEANAASSIFLQLVMYAAIVMVVLNATLMSVFERIREFGIMKAVGVKPRQVAQVIFAEVTAQATIASVIALLFGVPVSLYYQEHGINLSAWGGEMSFVGVAMDPIWYCKVTPSTMITPVVLLIIMSILAAVYPGFKAAFIRPLDAIRHQ